MFHSLFHSFHGLWRSADFIRLWSAQTLSLAGIQFGRLALPLVAVLTLDASAAQVGLLGAMAGVPWLIFGLFVGTVIDRFRRRPILIAVHAGRALLWGSAPVAAAFGLLTMGQLFVVAFLAGTLDVCFLVAYRSYLPSLVGPERLAEGNAKLAATDGITRTAGPSMAGAVVQLLTAPVALAVQAAAFLGSALCVWRIRHPEPEPSRSSSGREPVRAALFDGLRFAWRQPLVRAFTVSDASFLFSFSMLYAVQIVFFTRQLGLGPALIGVIFTTGSVGGLIAALVARRIGRRLRVGPTLVLGSLLRGGGLAVIPFAALVGPFALPLLIGSRLVNAFGWTLWEVHQETTQQLVVPNRLRGRVNGSTLFVSQGADSLGAFTGAGLAAAVGVLPTLAVGAVGAVLATGWLLTSHVRNIRLAGDDGHC